MLAGWTSVSPKHLTPENVEHAYELLAGYRLAQRYAGGKQVVNIGWEGIGYGTRMLAETAGYVVGLTGSDADLEVSV